MKQVRSAELASYIRVAYLGERYAKHIRATFLDAKDPEYLKRREACRYMLLARMDRDLRVAHGKSMLNTDEFQWLTRQVTLLSDGRPVSSATHPSAAVTREGVIKLTVGGHVVQGVYVFTYFDPKVFLLVVYTRRSGRDPVSQVPGLLRKHCGATASLRTGADRTERASLCRTFAGGFGERERAGRYSARIQSGHGRQR
nr:hypothetical protein GCM10020185_22920 [Pseudomonas brassicacearum subsp. brassicacearum]